MRFTLVPVIALGLTGVLTACGHQAAAGPAAVPPARGAPYTASTSCTPKPPDVIPFSEARTYSAGISNPPMLDLAPINGFMDAHDTVYGIPFYHDGHGYVGFTRDPQTHLAELRALVPEPDFWRAYCAPYDIATIRRVSDAIPKDTELKAHGLQVLSAGLDPLGGGVSVQLASRTADAEAILHQRYGEIIGTIGYGIPQGIAD